MNILFCTPEVYPFSKIGGVADFSASLPNALKSLSVNISVVSPYYERVRQKYADKMSFLGEKLIIFGTEKETARYYKTDYDGLSYYFIEHEFFNRKNFFNHEDDAKRFIFLNFAILEMLPMINYFPDIMHVNDWSTALIPYFLSSEYHDDARYEHIKTLLTIHNLEKQGSFDKSFERYFNKKNFTYMHLNDINFLKTGIMRSTRINTVSKSYRGEMLTKFFGFSLDGALKSRQYQLRGIQNGLDFDAYNPETDEKIFFNFNLDNYQDGKRINKEKLLAEIGFTDRNKAIVSFISRFAKEKGIQLIMETIEPFLKNDSIYFLVIGEGDEVTENYFTELSNTYPNNCHFVLGHNNEVSQKFYAASDLLLMPSLYEASGLNQMIAMRYGTLPVVRETGGLRDTVTPYDKKTNSGVGFTFENFDEEEFADAISAALDIYYNDKKTWNKIVHNAMQIDNDNDKMATEYKDLYTEILNDK